jgi:hypothetical protein
VDDVKPKTTRQLKRVAVFAACFIALWVLWPTLVVYPLKIFVVLLHEISHGLAAVATGGTIERITLTPDQGGVTWARGGNAFIILSAGYLGSLLWGLLLLAAARARVARLRIILFALGFFVAGISLLFVRGWFGLPFGVGFGVLLLLAAHRLAPDLQRGLLTVLGLTSALYALLDIRSDILQRPHIESDAHMLMELTGVHTLVWGVIWIALGLAACAWVLHREVSRA